MKLFTLAMTAITLVAGPVCVQSQTADFLDEALGGGTSLNSISIKSDGSAVVRFTYSQPRKTMEIMLRQFERYKSQADGEDDESDAKPPTADDQKPMADSEFEKKMRAMYEEREGEDSEAGGIQSLQLTKDNVEIAMTNSFASVEDLLGRSMGWVYQMGASGIKIEKDTNSHLRLTFTPASRNQDEAALRRQIKRSHEGSSFTLVLPGKILTSDFPRTQDNATGYSLDPKSDESIDKFIKLQSKPVIVTAELGGLAIDQPLDSKTLWRKFRKPDADSGPEIAITDAGPGFAAEASSVTTMTTFYFPGGEEYLKKSDRSFSYEQPGLTVSAKLFAPKGREIESLTDVNIVKAVDDKNREIAEFKHKSQEDSDDDQPDIDSGAQEAWSGGNSAKPGVIEFELRFSLPMPDAESISELSAEAVVKTSGSWKEMELKDLKKGATNEVDISQLIPGAKMTVTKYTVKEGNYSLEAQIEGPAADVPKIKVELRLGSKDHSSSNGFERGSKKTGDKMTRKITVNGYSFSGDEAAEPDATVLVRYPQDQKRERVRFKLSGLDLF